MSIALIAALMALGGPDAAGQLQVRADYAASVLVFRVGRVSLDAEIGPETYAADAHVEAAGLAALFTDFEIRSEVEGVFAGDQPQPARYGHVERTGDKRRVIEVAFEDGIARPSAEPDFSSWGDPPADENDRSGVLDPMTAVLIVSRADLAEGPPCDGALPVFDGKQRYDLRLVARGAERVRTRAWRGEALACDAYYEPISGYDPEDWPEPGETRHPLTLWFAPIAEGRAWLPVKAHTAAGFGGVTVEALAIETR